MMVTTRALTQIESKSVGIYVLESLADLGHRVMMDFGLAGLFDRFEKDFGRTLTKCLLGLIGLTIVAVCVSMVAQVAYQAHQWTTHTIENYHSVWLATKIITLAGFLVFAVILDYEVARLFGVETNGH